jgi:D-ribulokinase
MDSMFVGIDVGTGSVRAGLFRSDGMLLAAAKHPIATWHQADEIVEQSSDDIWSACGIALRAALADAAIDPRAVKGIGFDATCSLVVLDASMRPVSVSPSGEARRNIIVWMDHRAVGEARAINVTGHDVLRYVGGSISPEMQMPKLLWLKRHLPASFASGAHFFDLADFLTWRATGSLVRSTCTLTCKWTFLAHERRWSDDFLAAIGLSELSADGHQRIGALAKRPGEAAGGLMPQAAAELGLVPGTTVAVSLIDAHAGGLGTIGGRTAKGGRAEPLERIAYIMGTSACIMASTREARFVPGVWGPYFSAMIPDFWLNEGGQSAAGATVDHLVQSHVAYERVLSEAKCAGLGVLDHLERRIAARAPVLSEAALLARDLHVMPDLLGNRSPFAAPEVRGVVAGLSLNADVDDLERHLVAALCGLAYGLDEIIQALRKQGIPCRTIVASGGGSHSRLLRQILADATGMAVVLPETAEPVLLGAAMLGAVGSGAYRTFGEAMAAMSRDGSTVVPAASSITRFHAAKRDVHAMLRRLEGETRSRMAQAFARD